jgi:hypothetical protein
MIACWATVGDMMLVGDLEEMARSGSKGEG